MIKLVDYKSNEKEVLLSIFNSMSFMDNWIANLIENYIYAFEEYTTDNGHLVIYRTKYDLKDGIGKSYYPKSVKRM